MLTLPLVAAAGIALFFGARALFGFVFPLLFLFLAWPLPYSVLLENVLERITAATVASVELVNRATGVAQSEGDGLFRLHHGASGFDVSVASACSGIDSLIGFAIVGVAVLYLVTGPVLRRALWLAAGLCAVWVGNVVRITSILVVARVFGQQAALEWLHPVLGLVVINVVAVLLWLALPRFGLRARSPFTPSVSDTPIGRMVPEAERATPRAILARGAVFAVVALGLGVADGQLSGIAAAFANDGLPPVIRCYDFHNEDVLVNRSVVLDHGVVGHDYVYRATGGGIWHALTWEWPVASAGGQVSYERIVILASSNLTEPVGARAAHGDS